MITKSSEKRDANGKSKFHMDKDWILGIYTSGGSAHERAMEDLCQRIANIEKINLLSSTCTCFLFIGHFFAWVWNHAQQSGLVRLQILFGRSQMLAARIFFLPTYFTIYCRLRVRGKLLPKRVIATAPLFLSAICKAVIDANARSCEGKIESVDLYMIEPPTDEACYYFDTIKGLSLEKKTLLKLFAEHPTQEDSTRFQDEENYWMEKTGLKIKQIVFDSPVKHIFKQAATALPYPGEAVKIHIEGYDHPFQIKAQDKVGLIMLGGIPTSDAVIRYVEAALSLSRFSENICNYLFVACGKKPLGLYKKMHELLSSFQIPASLEVIPFCNQPVEKIFGRADFSITRSGGMTSLEILELKKRKEDDKLILLHAQIDHKEPHTLSQEDLIHQGIPLWEGGNARYLSKTVPNVAIVTPRSSATFMAQKFTPIG
ncbi:MAG: hypothetical protein V4494_06730 [Chlamydiota bacterium]